MLAFATWIAHRPHSGEITWAAVRADRHREGIGRRVVEMVERDAAAMGMGWMTVLTLSSNDPEGASYAPTRAFWNAMGYTEPRDLDIWHEDLAVLCAKRLATRA